jgi:hypothetical protein
MSLSSTLSGWSSGAAARADVVEADQIDILAVTMFGNLQQIDDAEEARLARQLWSDIRKTDGLDGIDLYLTFVHAIAGARFDVRTRPDSDTTGDFSATNAVAKAPGEDHEESLQNGAGDKWYKFRGNAGLRDRVH